MDPDFTLTLDAVGKPGRWKPLHQDFCRALRAVRQCASANAEDFHLTLVNITPTFVGATDDYQVGRWELDTGFAAPTRIRGHTAEAVCGRRFASFSVGEGWVHFEDPRSVVLACRRYDEEFPDRSAALAVEGAPLLFPKALGKVFAAAQRFSRDDPGGDMVTVRLRPGELTVEGRGVTGRFAQAVPATYGGPDVTFLIQPSLLAGLASQHSECQVSQTHLKVNAGPFTYVTVLCPPAEEDAAAGEG
jgi:hypothetical protein